MLNNLTLRAITSLPALTEADLAQETKISRGDVLALVKEKDRIKKGLVKANIMNKQVEMERDMLGVALRKKCNSTTEFMEAIADATSTIFGVDNNFREQIMHNEKLINRANLYSDVISGVQNKLALEINLTEVNFNS